MKLTNVLAYSYYEKLQNAFMNENRNFPVRVYFYILKNQKKLEEISNTIDETRRYIFEKYNIQFDENGQILNSVDEQLMANLELDELGKIEQEIEISYIKLTDIEDLELTPAQLEAIMFMIVEE